MHFHLRHGHSHEAPDVKSALERIKLRAHDAAADAMPTTSHTHTMVDVSVHFIGANNLRMHVGGSADPFFIATINDKTKFISSVQPNTLSPVWNEHWHIKNVPADGKLKVSVYDQDDGSPVDHFIGSWEMGLEEGTKEAKIEGSVFKHSRGTFWTNITLSPASSPSLLPYTFDGPITFSRHSSPTVGLLTKLDENGKRLYSTWTMRIKGVQSFLGGPPQHWNAGYSAAQRIFGTGPSSLAVRSSIQAGHSLLYARSTRNGFGTIDGAQDVLSLLMGGRAAPHRVKPAVYTYIIAVEDDTLRFSETGAAFFVDFASKHALHANCAEAVRYSGEFHPRPAGGWAAFDENTTMDTDVKWELVMDNNSGTYAPDKALLPKLRELIEYNIPGFTVVALDRADPELVQSVEACRAHALQHRKEGKKELQPHTREEGEETLSHRANNTATGMSVPKRGPDQKGAELEGGAKDGAGCESERGER